MADSDAVTFRFADNGLEIPNWLSYQFKQSFLQPTCEWSFTIDDEQGNYLDTLVYGVGINLYINGNIQCAGIIEKVTDEVNPKGGTVKKVQGRDIMAKVVEGGVNPKLQFPPNSKLEEIIKTVLKPLGITRIDNSDHLNLNVMTGKTFPVDEDQGFTKKQLQQLKTRYGEGAFQFIEKLLKRHGFMMWARADGKGVVVSQPNYTSKPLYTLKHSQDEKNNGNNMTYIQRVVDGTQQPSLLYCKGFNPGNDTNIVSYDVLMVNELIGLDYDGVPLPEVAAVIAQYQEQGAKVLNLRNVLIPIRQSFYQKPINVSPFYIKDDEAQSQEQLENFIKRTMADYQVKMLTLGVELPGHTQNGIPWSINTMVHVYDEALGIDEPWWIMDRTFGKGYSDGTYTSLKLIKPYTLDISTSGGKGSTTKVK